VEYLQDRSAGPTPGRAHGPVPTGSVGRVVAHGPVRVAQ